MKGREFDHSHYETWVDPKELIPYPKNAKQHDKAQVKNIANSIRRFGWQQEAVVTQDNVLVIGHGRRLAALMLKCEMPVKVIDQKAEDLTDEDIRELRIADNKTNESPWDFEMLTDDLDGLDFEGFDFDFDLPEEEEPVEITEDDYDKPLPEEPKSKLGDIYQLGWHRLMCGDSTSREDVAALMDGERADMVFTDPPYGMNAVSKSGVLSEHYDGDILGDDDNTVAINSFNLAQKMFNSAKHVWWGANYYTECLPSAECWVVWDKNNGESDQTDAELAWTNFRSVVRKFVMASEKTNRVHPTQKPCRLFGEIMRKFDRNNEIKTVLDLFGGSGSTLIACEQTGRKCFMMELDPRYVDVIINRWETFTGEKAVLISEG